VSSGNQSLLLGIRHNLSRNIAPTIVTVQRNQRYLTRIDSQQEERNMKIDI